MSAIDSRELKDLREFKRDTMETIAEISKLINYSDELRIVTGYKGGDKPNVQAIRNWIIRVKNNRYKEC